SPWTIDDGGRMLRVAPVPDGAFLYRGTASARLDPVDVRSFPGGFATWRERSRTDVLYGAILIGKVGAGHSAEYVKADGTWSDDKSSPPCKADMRSDIPLKRFTYVADSPL